MKNLNKLNYFFVGLPITLCLIGIINQEFLLFGLLFSMLTGIFQVIAGMGMLIKEPNNKYLKTYVIAVIIFFLLWFINSKIGYQNTITFILIGTPPILAIYLSIIIYKKAHK
ncbi:MAG: hypothetical protein V4548_11060 [Bacteroidota bacterium]